MKKLLTLSLLLIALHEAVGQVTAQNSATVVWNISPATNIVSQTLAWGTASGIYTYSINLAPNVNTFQITALSPGTTYFVAVQCRQAVGITGTNLIMSAWSPEIALTTYPIDRPAAPNGLKVTSQP